MQDVSNECKQVMAAVEAAKQEIIDAGDYIWKNPEPGYKEYKTSAFLVKKLEALGLKVKTGLAITGFRADIDTGRPGPTLAFMGELDSLIIPQHPECDKETGAVHSCGHCASAAAIYGTALGLLKSGVLDKLCGKIAIIATPAEEGIDMEFRRRLIKEGKIGSIAGKSQLIREGVFDDVDIAYMSHLSTLWGCAAHNGSVNKRISFYGKSCHAASPQNGVNALNAIALTLNAVGLMRESYSNDKFVRIHGNVSNGGEAVNVIPGVTNMEYMLRAPTLEGMLKLNERFDNIVMHAGLAAECSVEIESLNGFMPLYDDADLMAEMVKAMNIIAPGAEIHAEDVFYSSSTDMGDIATVVPAVHGYVPGAAGTGHGADYRIADKYSAYVLNSMLNCVMAVNLLYGDAEIGKRIAAKKANLMPIPEYIKIIDKINQTKTAKP